MSITYSRSQRGDTDALIAMRAGTLTRDSFEQQHGVTDINDRRHAAWYAEHRAQVALELRGRHSAPAPVLSADEQHERDLAWALEIAKSMAGGAA